MQESIHYPNLKTVLMVEYILKNANDFISKNEILRRSPKKMQRQTLCLIIDYLEEKRNVISDKRGILWIFNPGKKMEKYKKKGIKV